MHSKKPDGQQWYIKAEFTVSPQGVCPSDEKNPLINTTTQDKSGVRLYYSWKTSENASTADAGNYRLPRSDACKPVEYKKGNLIFTSTPACKPPCTATSRPSSNFEFHDSGYGSDLLSLNSIASDSSKYVNNPINRKCRSTCSIVLRSIYDNKAHQSSAIPEYLKCGRTSSLRCQTPDLQNTGQNVNFYGCGDPWCHHANPTADPLSGKVSRDVQTFTQHQATSTSLLPPRSSGVADYKAYKKDASIQTSDSLEKFSGASSKSCDKIKSKIFENTNRKNFKPGSTRGQISSSTRDSGENSQTSTSRKPVDRSKTSGYTSDSSKKSRTIHIDVYCTDTEIEPSESSSGSWDSDSVLTPETVFESENVYVTHKRAKDDGVPRRLKRYPKNISHTSMEKEDSDVDDESSTGYPSKLGSYSTINDFSSSISSIKSWRNYSLSSYTNDQDSFENMSALAGPNKLDPRKRIGKQNNYKIHNQQTTANDFRRNYLGQGTSEAYGRSILSQQGTAQATDPNGSNTNKIKENAETLSHEMSVNRSKQSGVCGETLQHTLPKEKMISDHPTSQSPLLVVPGQHAEHIASRFGKIINALKRPGHHTGPTKNPDCCCDHCRRYFM